MFNELHIPNESKILLIVLDGLGGLEKDGKTELETADTPNLDKLAAQSSLGLTTAVDIGITPGSGPAHLALFGYDPLENNIGRGVLAALGIGYELKRGDVAARGNFARIEEGVITDRRAGRIPTEENERLCRKLTDAIDEIEEVKIHIRTVKQHRFVVVFEGEGLSHELTESDPQIAGKSPLVIKALAEDAGKTARIVNRFVLQAQEVLEDEDRANTILLRGFASLPDLIPFPELYELNAAAIATYPMYKGLSKLVGMNVLETGSTWEDELQTLKNNLDNYNFFYLHFKETDAAGEDGDFDKKVKLIAEFDSAILPELMEMGFDVLVVTGDHSTPALLASHSWHPNPFLLHAPGTALTEGRPGFSERICARGVLGQLYSLEVMSLLLAHAKRLKKYGA
ncbi:2,3-bisphosphoglycerate-independent phosphoglycerate mutase [candidate division WOR-3 bacterium]|uniref:2,3-bisphosphoglycerate-independent phosphoglycerate mutase n=1 Tax=candidate division WOR-3 bacterium TaxID=2052148 RepID=A0A9D5K8X3_UNCW3|nr:2,3-bisphosphoglycerate-independent phosphoglycerate mutase [candidate division WOR-3 bacterium]MBD3364508.1 2,3-bisphosphoglycerate-independent phosphoglycerate mutase [candidate division WOR-3 bacterium]